MSPERLREIQDRCDKATPGPWEVIKSQHYPDYEIRIPDYGTVCFMGDYVIEGFNIDQQDNFNASFAANARKDIPDLLAEVERLKQELSRERNARRRAEERVRSRS